MHIYESSSMVLGPLQAVSSRQRLRVISTSLPPFHSPLKPSFHPPHQTASFSTQKGSNVFSPPNRVSASSQSPKGSHIRPTRRRFPVSHRLISHLSIPLTPALYPPKWTFSSWGCSASERRCVGNGFWVAGLWRGETALCRLSETGGGGGTLPLANAHLRRWTHGVGAEESFVTGVLSNTWDWAASRTLAGETLCLHSDIPSHIEQLS